MLLVVKSLEKEALKKIDRIQRENLLVLKV